MSPAVTNRPSPNNRYQPTYINETSPTNSQQRNVTNETSPTNRHQRAVTNEPSPTNRHQTTVTNWPLSTRRHPVLQNAAHAAVSGEGTHHLAFTLLIFRITPVGLARLKKKRTMVWHGSAELTVACEKRLDLLVMPVGALGEFSHGAHFI